MQWVTLQITLPSLNTERVNRYMQRHARENKVNYRSIYI